MHTYKKAELKSFLQFHRTGEEPLRDDEISILSGVLELNTKKVESIMTPMKVGPSSPCMGQWRRLTRHWVCVGCCHLEFRRDLGREDDRILVCLGRKLVILVIC